MIFYLLLVATPTNQKVEFAQAQVSWVSHREIIRSYCVVCNEKLC